MLHASRQLRSVLLRELLTRPRFGQRNCGDLSGYGRFAKAQHRLLYCNAYRPVSPSSRGTPLFNFRLTHDKVLAILEHLAEVCGIRQTARLVGVNKATVTRLALIADRRAKTTHDELLAFFPSSPRGPVR